MAFQAGSAYSDYTLNIDGLRRNVTEAKALLRSLQADIDKLARTPAPGSAGGAPSGGGASPDRQRAAAIREVEQALARQAAQERAALVGGQRIADSEVRAAVAARDYARALQLVDQQLEQAIPDTTRYNNLLAQQATLSRRAAQPPPGPRGGGGSDISSAIGGLQAAGGLLAGGGALAGVTSFAVGAGQEALELRKTENVLREISGTQANYNNVIALAHQNQGLYGGSLQENIDQLQGFAVAARRSGVAVQTLNDLSKRLAVLSPEQGAGGASIAINEALSGNAASLVKRFEIPKDLLRGIEDQSLSASEKLKILDDALTKSGVSAATVKAATDPIAQTYNNLGAAADRAKTGLGDLFGRAFRTDAANAANVLNAVADSLNQAGAAENAGRNIAAASTSYDDYLAKLRDANAQIPFYIQHIQELTPAQFADIQAREQATRAQEDHNNSVQAAIDKGVAHQDELRQSGVEAAANAVNQQVLNTELERQKEAADQAAAGLYASSGGMDEAGIQALVASGKIDVLEAAYLRLRVAADAPTKAAAGGLGVKPEDIGKGIPALGDTGGPGKGNAPRRTQAPDEDPLGATARAQRQAVIDAQRAQDYALASTAGKVKILRAELAQLTPGTANYIKKQTELRQAQAQLAAEQDRAAAKGEKAESAAERKRKAEEKALLAQERQTNLALDTIENRYEQHYAKLRQQQEDYELSSSRDREDFEQQKQKLLAEGQIKEARLLEAQFNKEQRRKAEDFQRQRSRENADVAADVARSSERANIRGVKGIGGAGGVTPPDLAGLPTGAPVASAAGALPTAAAVAGGAAGAFRLRIEFAPVSLNVDSQRMASVLFGPIEEMLDISQAEAIIRVAATNPPNAGQNAGLGGQRP